MAGNPAGNMSDMAGGLLGFFTGDYRRNRSLTCKFTKNARQRKTILPKFFYIAIPHQMQMSAETGTISVMYEDCTLLPKPVSNRMKT